MDTHSTHFVLFSISFCLSSHLFPTSLPASLFSHSLSHSAHHFIPCLPTIRFLLHTTHLPPSLLSFPLTHSLTKMTSQDYRVSTIVILCKDCGNDVGAYPGRHKCPPPPAMPAMPSIPSRYMQSNTPPPSSSRTNGRRPTDLGHDSYGGSGSGSRTPTGSSFQDRMRERDREKQQREREEREAAARAVREGKELFFLFLWGIMHWVRARAECCKQKAANLVGRV